MRQPALVVAAMWCSALGCVLSGSPATASPPSTTPPAPVKGERIEPEWIGTFTWAELDAAEKARVGPVPFGAIHAPLPGPPEGREIGLDGPPDIANPSASSGNDLGFIDGIAPRLTPGFEGLPDFGYVIPPDTNGAVGPDHIMVMLNDYVMIQSRSGTPLGFMSLYGFWYAVDLGGPFDPLVFFDEISGRWIACACDSAYTTYARVLFAISESSDPFDAWSFYSFTSDPTGYTWADYPRMGFNSTWVAITANMFTVENGNFTGVRMWVFDKAALLDPSLPLAVTMFPDRFDEDPVFHTHGFTLVPAVTHDADEDTLWIVDRSGIVSSGIQTHRLSSITGTGPAPVWSRAPGGAFSGTGLYLVPKNYSPANPIAVQPGTTRRIDAGDPRILDAEFRNGHLWYTHAAGLPANGAQRTSVLWYETDPRALLSKTVIQNGAIDIASVFHTYPSIAVNAANDVLIGFTRTSASIYAEAACAFRLHSDAPGTMRPVARIKVGEAPYTKDFGGNSVRWGDYSATCVDPVDDLSMWTLQEYAAQGPGTRNDNDRWGTWWAQLRFRTSACPADIDGDGTANTADFNILAAHWGQPVEPSTNGDLNGDGLVDSFDVSIFATAFGCED